LNYTVDGAISYSWAFECKKWSDNTTITPAAGATTSTQNYSIISSDITVEATCTFTASAFNSISELIKNVTLSFDVILGDPLVYVTVDGN